MGEANGLTELNNRQIPIITFLLLLLLLLPIYHSIVSPQVIFPLIILLFLTQEKRGKFCKFEFFWEKFAKFLISRKLKKYPDLHSILRGGGGGGCMGCKHFVP
jgi:hypothetical protein